MYGTQDAIARLYSSPAGTRRSSNPTMNQSPASTNRNMTYNQGGSTNQNVSYNQVPPSSTHNISGTRPSNLSSFQNYNHSHQSNNNYGRQLQNVSQNKQTGHSGDNSYSRQSDYGQSERFSKQNGFNNNNSSDMFYTQSNFSSNHLTPSGQDYRSQNSQNSNFYRTNNSGSNYSGNRQRYNQNGSMNAYQSTDLPQQYTQNQSNFRDRLDMQNDWKYVGNGDIGNSQSGYISSVYTQQVT